MSSWPGASTTNWMPRPPRRFMIWEYMSSGRLLGMEPVSTSVSPAPTMSMRSSSSSTFFSGILGPMPLTIVMTMPLSLMLMRV